MLELKPCPFCGGKAWTTPIYRIHMEKTRYIVKCTKCNAIMEYRSQEAVEKAWNRRVGEPDA